MLPIIPQKSVRQTATAGAQVVNRPGTLYRVILSADTVAAVARIYDATSSAGSPLLIIQASALTTPAIPLDGFPFNIGIYAVVTGTNAELIIHHG